MKCPLCDQPIHEGAECCPHCDTDASQLSELYADYPQNLRLLHDGAGIFKIKERRQIERWISKFSKEFPTCFLSIHSADLSDIQNVQSYGIWALNIPRYVDLPASAVRDSGVFLVIDAHSKQVAISYGYQLEPYLTSESCFQVLAPAHPYLLDASYFEALELMRHGIRKLIRAKARWAKFTLKKKHLTDRILS